MFERYQTRAMKQDRGSPSAVVYKPKEIIKYYYEN
jgi:hypothetical protein